MLDVSAALAQVSVERNYLRPEVDDTLSFVVEGGRHPVVEQALAQDGQPFVANDCDLFPAATETAGRIYLLTGLPISGAANPLSCGRTP